MTPSAAEGITQALGPFARYTRFVRSTKLMLALLAAILSGLILFYPILKKDSGTRIAFTSIVKKAGGGTQMLNARYHSLDKDNQPYNLTAKIATQVDDDTLNLDRPTGDITLKGGAWLSVSGNEGVFKIKAKELDLKGSIDMFNNEGYEFRTERMHVNVGDKTAVTHDLVKGQGPLGRLTAYGGAFVEGKTEVITFEGPVFVTVYPSQKDDAKQTAAGEK